MIKRSLKLVALYGVGLVAIWAWALGHWFGGTVTAENAADVIVFPLAWTFGFWPVVMPLLVARRIWRLQSVVEELGTRAAAGVSTDDQEQEIEDTLTLLAMEENPIVPERFARRLVRGLIRKAKETADAPEALPADPG